MSFPLVRMRRLRRSQAVRDLVAETTISADDFIYPIFIVEGGGVCEPVSSMPGVNRFSVDLVVDECRRVWDLGVKAVMLFGIPQKKDGLGTGAYDEKGVVPKASRAIKKALPQMVVTCDVCLCEYTDHGHCGVIHKKEVHNDATLELLAKAAVTYARAGADMLVPSDMMDGRILEIRETLDEEGFEDRLIMAHSAKYASAFYGPFRDAAENPPQFGDRKSYQMDPRNAVQALREVSLDIEEGADIVLIKPAGPYLDIIARVADDVDLPVATYQVSGEYAMIKAAAQNGWVDHDGVMMESLIALKRAGADIIVTYFAAQAAELLAGGR